jgi:hypothetical protein
MIILTQIKKSYSNFTLITPAEISLKNTSNRSIVLFSGISNVTNSLFGRRSIERLAILIGKENEEFILNYEAESNNSFSYGLPLVKKMIDSFRIGDIASEFQSPPENFFLYQDPRREFTILYPSDWGKMEIPRSNNPIVRFFSPIGGAYLLRDDYYISFNVPTVYGSETSGYVDRLYWTQTNKTWTEGFEEVSLNSNFRPISVKSGNQTSYEIGDNFIHLPIDLHLMNMPSEYDMNFANTIQFIANGKLCILDYRSQEVSIPLPKFSIIPETKSLTIGPGETKKVVINVQSHTNISF